jgi:hypothetical protein
MKRLEKLLCALGFHSWHTYRKASILLPAMRVCVRCDKSEMTW